ncbi:hypothetical protein JK358_07825 [Nocardia sp. 2]|uniref:Uncharacterized protein n=1 Tax=Nocardia acididurans TaxID=2802282 RepID=A0ABS1M595_9NOCA|nr:hypothetical protein [Nocardia acididurans]MBL1074303.1 hypothetical protein [Nocardia acididurans]
MLVTVNPEAELGTEDAPGVSVMATADPEATELGAVPSTEVLMLDVWPMPKIVPWQLQFMLIAAAFAGVAEQKTAASAIGATMLVRSSADAIDLITISNYVKHRYDPECRAVPQGTKM